MILAGEIGSRCWRPREPFLSKARVQTTRRCADNRTGRGPTLTICPVNSRMRAKRNSLGSLREFLGVDARQRVMEALSKIIVRAFHCTSDKRVERLRIQGMEDPMDAACYINPLRWKAGTTSLLALRHLSTMMKPDFFETPVSIARKLKHDQLEDAALEGYFHTLVRHERSITIDYYACKSGEEDDANDDTVSINGARGRKVTCSDDSIEACERMMEKCAEDALAMDGGQFV